MGLYALQGLRGDAMSLVGFKANNHRQQVGKRGALDKVDDRRTPRSLFDPLNEEFEFTLDAAASAENALTVDFYDLAADGLFQRWSGSVWCNPPYSNLREWVSKASFESKWCDSIVMLLPANRTEQAWWQDFIEQRRRAGLLEVRFLRGRLRFDTPDHDYTKQPKGNRPPFGVCLVIWRRPQMNLWPAIRMSEARLRAGEADKIGAGHLGDAAGPDVSAATESPRATAERIVRDVDSYGDPGIYALAESYLRFINRPLPSQASVHDLNHEITRLHTVIDCLLPANGCVTVEEAIRAFGEKP